MKTLTLVVVLAIAPLSAQAEQYLCITDQVTGFAFNAATKQWERTSFEAGSKYVIAESQSETSTFNVKEIEPSPALLLCTSSFNETGFLFCEGFVGSFKFNRKNGRYLRAHLFGYFNVIPGAYEITDATSDPPYIEIGKCSPF
ncbi:MAG: hypothetical protein L0Y67_08830 [Gammaproteobacteria bacterium]|nr:hypothetical protein [Gammaproteobacteria bacterium]MCI0591675.1 hypothetical protein [Gammaproteobacteria bacterium]